MIKQNFDLINNNAFVKIFHQPTLKQSNHKLLTTLLENKYSNFGSFEQKSKNEQQKMRTIGFSKPVSKSKSINFRSRSTQFFQKQLPSKDIKNKSLTKIITLGKSLNIFPSNYKKQIGQTQNNLRRKSGIKYYRINKNEMPSIKMQQNKMTMIKEGKDQFRVDYEAFNYIDKVIDRKQLWKQYVKKIQ